jgi:protein-tyrosine phosphatase
MSASQEASLNSSVSKYIIARNNCQLVGLVGFTYPELVKEFKDMGDSIFKQKFDCKNNSSYQLQLQNPTLRTVEKKGLQIQVLYEFDAYRETEEKVIQTEFKLVAISENEGINWFFMQFDDYVNKDNCKLLDRLLK